MWPRLKVGYVTYKTGDLRMARQLCGQGLDAPSGASKRRHVESHAFLASGAHTERGEA